jgi:hypothetical protein
MGKMILENLSRQDLQIPNIMPLHKRFRDTLKVTLLGPDSLKLGCLAVGISAK